MPHPPVIDWRTRTAPDLAPGELVPGRRPACRSVDPETFFSTHPDDERAAVALCWGCPLRRACAEHALANGEWYGTWGGLTESERRKLIRRSA